MKTTVCKRLRKAARSSWRFFFPRQVQLPALTRRRLEKIYPSVDWSRVRFFIGWPHLLKQSSFSAITLPDPHSLRRVNIYFQKEAWQPEHPKGFSTIVHEGYHVLQLFQAAGGKGVGLVRPFIIRYLMGWAASGFSYQQHPMEKEAYQVAGTRDSLLERKGWEGMDQPRLVELSWQEQLVRYVPGLKKGQKVLRAWKLRRKGSQEFYPGRLETTVLTGAAAFYAGLWGAAVTGVVLGLEVAFLAVEGIGVCVAGSVRGLAALAENVCAD